MSWKHGGYSLYGCPRYGRIVAGCGWESLCRWAVQSSALCRNGLTRRAPSTRRRTRTCSGPNTGDHENVLNTMLIRGVSEPMNSLPNAEMTDTQTYLRRRANDARHAAGRSVRPLAVTGRWGQLLSLLQLNLSCGWVRPGDILLPAPPWKPPDARTRLQVHLGGVQALPPELLGREGTPA